MPSLTCTVSMCGRPAVARFDYGEGYPVCRIHLQDRFCYRFFGYKAGWRRLYKFTYLTGGLPNANRS